MGLCFHGFPFRPVRRARYDGELGAVGLCLTLVFFFFSFLFPLFPFLDDIPPGMSLLLMPSGLSISNREAASLFE